LTVLIEPHYLPCIAFFAVALQGDTLRIEKHEHFVKQSFRNRCYINTEHGLDSLNIPLRHEHGKVAIADIRIDHTQKWVNNHWRSITSAYGKSPFFEYYSDDLRRVLFRKHDFLYGLNYELLTLCLRWLRSEVRLEESLEYQAPPELEEETVVKDYRGVLSPRKPENLRAIYKAVPYQQVFGNAFVENTSLIDAIFCCGPGAGRIVTASSRRQ
jgi:hypothetical protein